MQLENILAHGTNRIFESKDGTTTIKIVNQIERHNFYCSNDLLNKFNRTEIKAYKVEERTFGTPCMDINSEVLLQEFNKHLLFIYNNAIESYCNYE